MAKRTTTAGRKTLSRANLKALGADRLAELLMDATAGDANLKRRLRLELAAEVGPADLSLEIDKRLVALAASRTRVSWRKRPELLADLRIHLRAIVDRLGAAAPEPALERLVAWFDLYPGLTARVKDPKGELAALFLEAAEDLGRLASQVDPDRAASSLAEAVETRLSDWAGWTGRAAPVMDDTLVQRLLARLTDGKARPTGRRALAIRRLADRVGDARTWAQTWTDAEQTRPEVGAEIARRLAVAGDAEAARQALETARPRPLPSIRRRGVAAPADASPAWDAAEIAVLEAEGRTDDAQAARWNLFERTLDPDHLRAFVARLPDFDDVEAIDRGLRVAADWPDAQHGLTFLMEWPEPREAAAMILARRSELKALSDVVPLWIAKLEGRYPNAALALTRARAQSLARLGPGRVDEVRALSAEAAELALRPGALDGLEPHAAFVDALEAASPMSWQARSYWDGRQV